MTEHTIVKFGEVRPIHGKVRHLFVPVYGLDQFILLAVATTLFLLLNLWNPALALYIGIGAYIGYVVSMRKSAPCELLLPAKKREAVVSMLEGAPLIRRTNKPDEWVSRKRRLWRWDSDTIRLISTTDGLVIKGRRYDLRIIAQRRRV